MKKDVYKSLLLEAAASSNAKDDTFCPRTLPLNV
jgi:hypothetical protein